MNVLKGFLLLGCLGLSFGPAWAGRIKDEDSNISFVPPPYYQTSFGKTKPIHYILAIPNTFPVITTGAILDRKFSTVRPLNAAQVKAFCQRAETVLPKGLTLDLSKRQLIDGQNGFECRFSQGSGRSFRWVGIPGSGQLLFFMGEWSKPHTDKEATAFREFLGSIQIF